MIRVKNLFLTAVLTLTAFQLSGQAAWLPLPIENDYHPVGQLVPKTVHEVRNESLTVGCEVLDRDYTDYDEYKTYLPQLGIKKIRLQAGWAKTERVKGVYDFAWLDHIIDDARSRGMKIWLQTSYGNPIYEGGGTINLGGGMPVSEEAKAAWNRWVEAMVTRYLGKVDEWEIWNEPDLSRSIPAEAIVDMNLRTADIIKRIDPEAKIAGFALCTLNGELLEECLRQIAAVGKLELFRWVSYHGYDYRPENSYRQVMNLRRILDKYAPQIRLRQGENGAPSRGHMGGALDNYDWTELSQAKWDLRRLINDHGHDVESSVFSIIDMAYPPGKNQFVSKLNVKGLISSDSTKRVLRMKLAFRAVQHYATLFDHFSERIRSYRLNSPGSDHLTHYAFRNGEGKSSLLIWRSDKAPLNDNTFEYLDITTDACTFEHPVWVDLLTGWIYAIPADCVQRLPDGQLLLRSVPVYDSPIVILDQNML